MQEEFEFKQYWSPIEYQALECIKNKDSNKLNELEFKTRMLISYLKNDLENLEFLLNFLHKNEHYTGAGSYFYTDIIDNKTFDLYHKYKIYASNCRKYCMTNEQWNYLYKIGYINKKQYDLGE